MQSTCLCTPDLWIIAVFSVPAFVVGMWMGVRPCGRHDDPEDDPHARPFADSEGGKQ